VNFSSSALGETQSNRI